MFFFKNHAKIDARRLVHGFLKKTLYEVKASDCSLVSIYFDSPPIWHTIRTNCIKLTIDPEICSILIFLEKGLGIFSPPHFVYDFSRKIFLILYCIVWRNFIVWLPLLLEILVNMFIAIVCFVDCDEINYEINLILVIKPFLYMAKILMKKQVDYMWKITQKNEVDLFFIFCFVLFCIFSFGFFVVVFVVVCFVFVVVLFFWFFVLCNLYLNFNLV